MIDTEILKKKILDLAIRGKLTKQLSGDGNAEELFEQIQEEKARLVKEGKIKREKPLPEISSEEISFEIPENWKWVRWGDLSLFIQYGYNAPAKENGRIKMVRISDIQNGKIEWGKVPYCDIGDNEIEGYLLHRDDILFARTGGTVGKSYLVTDIPEKSIYAGYLIRTRCSDWLCRRYMKYFMESSLYWEQLKNGTIATAQPNCNGKTLSKMILPLPPFTEQHRIVQRLDEIFECIAKIEKLQEKYIADVEILKNKIIYAGIQGKLTKQLPKDGKAEELYQQIKKEKDKMIREGMIKKEKSLPEIKEEEMPFEIPENWKWVRIGDIMRNRDSERIPVSVIDRKKLKKIYDYYGASGVIDKVENYLFDKKLLLIGEDGANLLSRNTPIAFLAKGKYWVNNHAHVLEGYVVGYLEFVMHYINSINLAPYVTGSAQPKLNQDNLHRIPVPLAPLKEQRRILYIIDELMEITEKYIN